MKIGRLSLFGLITAGVFLAAGCNTPDSVENNTDLDPARNPLGVLDFPIEVPLEAGASVESVTYGGEVKIEGEYRAVMTMYSPWYIGQATSFYKNYFANQGWKITGPLTIAGAQSITGFKDKLRIEVGVSDYTVLDNSSTIKSIVVVKAVCKDTEQACKDLGFK